MWLNMFTLQSADDSNVCCKKINNTKDWGRILSLLLLVGVLEGVLGSGSRAGLGDGGENCIFESSVWV